METIRWEGCCSNDCLVLYPLLTPPLDPRILHVDIFGEELGICVCSAILWWLLFSSQKDKQEKLVCMSSQKITYG